MDGMLKKLLSNDAGPSSSSHIVMLRTQGGKVGAWVVAIGAVVSVTIHSR
jgi:hypothetical protein